MDLIKSYLFLLSNYKIIDVAGGIYIPLSNNSQSPLSSTFLSPLLPPNRYFNRYPNRHPNKYSNSDMDYLNNKLDSDAIKALQPSSNNPFSFTYC